MPLSIVHTVFAAVATAAVAILASMSGTGPPPAPPLDGFELRHLPAELGEPSDFAYEFDDVRFTSRVWERSTAEGSAVDLTIVVMRGDVLSDVTAVHEFLAGYHEQDAATWGQDSFDANGQPGFRTDDRVVIAVEPGVAVSVSIDWSRFSDDDLTATALGVTPQRTTKSGGQVTRPR